MDKPIFCTLTESQFAERRRTVLSSLQRNVKSISRTASGVVYEFPATTEMSRLVHHAVELESECCASLAFDIDENEQRIQLEVSGSEGAIAMIEDLFGGLSQ